MLRAPVAATTLTAVRIERRTELPVSAEDLYRWHERPGAFERLVPPWEQVHVVGDPPGLGEGSRLVFDIRAGLMTRRWVAVHTNVVPGRGFVDVQDLGPFSSWRHEHRFEPVAPASAALVDVVEFELPGGPLGELAEPWVRKRLRRALRYRHATTGADLRLHASQVALPRLTVAITGSFGLIGRTLSLVLATGGHRVLRLVRRPPASGEIQWDPAAGTLDPGALTGVDAVVHLAGENIASRWTAARRREIRESRARGTATVVRALLAAPAGPRVLISASAVGYYGDRGDQILAESAPPGQGFLPEVARAWEGAADPARAAGLRVVHPRFGVVLSPAGGALRKMLPPFSLGLGATLGSGRQWVSWIGIDDAVGALVHLLGSDLEGAVNVVAPDAVTNAKLTATLARVLRRPAPASVPASVLRIGFDGLADEGLLASTRASAATLEGTGYQFRHPHLEAALRHVLGRETGW